MMGMLAELKRSFIKEWTKAGREAAMKRGVKMGHKAKALPATSRSYIKVY
jgi:DNA invertase Pin-like site-specific DNA recombinase